MGFTTGFLGGLTLTSSLLYLSLYLHHANRTHQHTILSQQTQLLTSFTDPPSFKSQSRINPETYEVESRGRKPSITGMLKERWNEEVEGTVRKAQETDWRVVRERWANRGVNLWKNMTGE